MEASGGGKGKMRMSTMDTGNYTSEKKKHG